MLDHRGGERVVVGVEVVGDNLVLLSSNTSMVARMGDPSGGSRWINVVVHGNEGIKFPSTVIRGIPVW